jgi:biopolymer transport protein ExbD
MEDLALRRRRPFRGLIAAAALAIAATTASCGEEKPLRIVALHVDADGKYLLEGTQVDLSELKNALRALRSSEVTTELHIHTKPESDFQAVSRAVSTSQESGIALVKFVTQSPK